MACFLVPAAEAVVTTAVQKIAEKKGESAGGEGARNTAMKWSQRLGWLNKMLWGGVMLLCLEHIWHGEVQPWPPFLTAMDKPGEFGPMIHEIYTFGVPMTITVTAVWAIMVAFVELKDKAAKNLPEERARAIEGGA
ncbi:MAG: hypothetical protein PHV74_02505 [Dehalococcoidia bacterium]|nr:hypothetical protein [Dehalococcoidia bacterium]